ncbi:sulfatase-like hydrolase/transferase [Verrucomicrobiaceae bacterium 5K15]|uniref:Sulfatase-like hydrolase/transferase n=1 Tax=Oceaniferula flava TaxID=2800421 RepID=A0AAE2SEE1_9BACT|nr:sulfatase-like hydrolase/transferase [Oceaniferula flavus]MBK1856234.1 sulfatase-like hydrolase/transferase [Oceaniferula flavus]MBM1137541.1 sulfatase-like hydrolase/transferase [Oceaniferula flavus]
MMSKKGFLLALFACSFGAVSSVGAAEPAPNILVILLDDAGYNDFGFMGGTSMKTPNIDRLAASGMVCTDAHTSGTTCSPSRAGIMTGRYQQRFGHHENTPPHGKGMDPSEKTMGDALKAGGYKTMYVGKWHLGDMKKHYPTNRGWDEFVGLREGSRSYFPRKNEKLGDPRAIEHNGKLAKWDGYLTDYFTDVAVDYLKQAKDKPFCMFLSYTAPHTPMHAKKEHLKMFEGHPRQKLAAMLWSVDEGIGRVLQTLEELNLRENTLVFFLSDNGGSSASRSDNGPLKGYKGTKFEGGQRVPFVVSWPAKIPEGGTYQGLVSALDIYPTSARAAGAPLDLGKALDGVNLIPFLLGENMGEPHEVLYWSRSIEDAIRVGDYKLIGHEHHGWRLYNLKEDIGETKNLTALYPEKVQEMQELYLAWEKQLPNAKWSSPSKWVKLKSKMYGELLKRDAVPEDPSATRGYHEK